MVFALSHAGRLQLLRTCAWPLSSSTGLCPIQASVNRLPSSALRLHWKWHYREDQPGRRLLLFQRSFSMAEENRDTNGAVPDAKSEKSKSEARRKRRQPIDYSQEYTDNNYIPAVRAMTDYLLKPKDLENVRKSSKRSPVTDSPPLTVYLRKDVEQRAVEVWGSMEALQREKKKKREVDLEYNMQVSNVKRLLRDIARGKTADGKQEDRDAFQNEMMQGSRRVVFSAIVINAANFAFKFLAWLYTGSHSMFAETIHSFADTCNQIILAVGLMGSAKKPDKLHPYGYSSLRYVSSLVSGLGIFFFGFGLSVYHGIMGLVHPSPVGSLYWALFEGNHLVAAGVFLLSEFPNFFKQIGPGWLPFAAAFGPAFFVLAGSLLSEGGTLLVALGQIRKHARQQGVTIWNYVLRGQDPNVNVVLLEDMAAVVGVAIAASSMGLASYYDSHLPDVIGSLCIGGLLGCVASFIIYTNTVALVGRSIPLDLQQQLTKVLESDVLVRSVYDVKAIDLGGLNVRYKAEIDFDGRQLTRSYLDKQDMERILEEVQQIKTIEELESFMSKHGENIVDLLGSEVDRIEANLKKKYPEVRHVDLEVL